MHLIGVMSVDWNFCETRLDALLQIFLGVAGRDAARQLGNQTKCDILMATINKLEKKIEKQKIWLNFL
jgi:hypothetical protein